MQCDGADSRLFFDGCEKGCLLVQFGMVTLLKLFPASRVVLEPLPQTRRWPEIGQPEIELHRLL